MYEMNEERQERVFKNFKKIIDKKDVSLINKELYYHLNLNCNFSAHFNLEGFRSYFDGSDGFHEFTHFFDKNSPMSQWVDAPEISSSYQELNYNLLNYGTERLNQH